MGLLRTHRIARAGCTTDAGHSNGYRIFVSMERLRSHWTRGFRNFSGIISIFMGRNRFDALYQCSHPRHSFIFMPWHQIYVVPDPGSVSGCLLPIDIFDLLFQSTFMASPLLRFFTVRCEVDRTANDGTARWRAHRQVDDTSSPDTHSPTTDTAQSVSHRHLRHPPSFPSKTGVEWRFYLL